MWFRTPSNSRYAPSRPAAGRPGRLAVEALEDRAVPAYPRGE